MQRHPAYTRQHWSKINLFVQQYKDEVIGGWRKLYNEELHKLHSSPNTITMIKSRKIRLAGHAARMKKRNIGYWWASQKKRPLGRTRRKWVDSVRMDLR
jgi:hypothetical protein